MFTGETMKRIFILILFLCLCLPVFAEYKPIPPELSTQYKKDIERIIDKGYPKSIKKVDSFTREATTLYKRILKNGYYSNNQMDVINLTLLYENCLPASDIDLYASMYKVTQQYLNMNYAPLSTDSVASYEEFLQPYLVNNKIDTKKLNDIVKYEAENRNIVRGYIKKAETLRPIFD